MWIVDALLAAACVTVNLYCDDGDGQVTRATLPEGEARAWSYTRPKPEPAPQTPIVVHPPTQPSMTQIIVHAPAESPAEPQKQPRPDPAIAASRALLSLRRQAAVEARLNPVTFSVKTEPPTLPQPSARKPMLNFRSRQPRYEAPGLKSSLPVDNARILAADRYIPVILETAINSQLDSDAGGTVKLVVARDVYGYHSRKVLIPKFSRLICEYSVPDHANSTRLAMRCKRILAGDTRFEIYQLGAVVSGPQGQGGVTGDVDKRFWERYGTAFMLAGISTAVRMASGGISSKDNRNLSTSLNAGAEQLSTRLGEITARILEQTVSLKPIIRIAQGTRLQINLQNDWYLASTTSNDNGNTHHEKSDQG